MQAAAYSSSPAFTLPGSLSERDFADARRLSIYDVPDEWTAFSRPVQAPAPAFATSGGLWESQLVVRGMHCAACSLTVEQTLTALDGVVSVRVSAATRRATVIWSDARTRPSTWLAAPRAAGYELVPAADAFLPGNARQEARLALWRWLVAGFCMMQVMMYAAPAYFSSPGDISPDIEKLLRWASWVLSLPVIFFSCSPFFTSALRDLLHRRISMDLPVAIGIAITFVISTAATFEPQGWWGADVFFDSLTMFVFFLLTGRWFEQRLRQRTAGSLEVLMQRLPPTVERKRSDGQFERVAVRRLKVGDTVRVLPGEAFPADGAILNGETQTDEALLTGESRPVDRCLGESVMAGSFNLSQPVEVKVQALGAETRYAQIVALMEQASTEKPRLAQLADRAARPFLWFVLVAAAAAAAYGWSSGHTHALMGAVAVLVVTCPCALSLATPSAMLTSAGVLARQGVLVRRLQAIESLAGIDTVVFDKTGTLTDTQLGLRTISTRAGVSEADALELASMLAAHSLHPVSRALVAAFEDRQKFKEPPDFSEFKKLASSASSGLPTARLRDVREVAGRGVEAIWEPSTGSPYGGPVRLGTAAFCQVYSWPGEGLQVYLADGQGMLACFELGEAARHDAVQAVATLQRMGMAVHVLSGDRQSAVLRLAGQLGIRYAVGDCTPEGKLQHLHALQRQGRKVLMVGDGLNDGPVLAGAHVSVAVGSAVPLAQGQADFVMPDGRLLMLPAMVRQATRTLSVVRQNLWWAALYNALCVPLAVAGYMPAWLAGLGMALSSLLVIANAARLAGDDADGAAKRLLNSEPMPAAAFQATAQAG